MSDPLGRHACSADVRGVWWRRPLRPSFPGLATREDEAAGDQWQAFAEALASVPGPRWVSDPASIRAAEDKARQLDAARALGIRVPSTLVTNDVEDARKFLAVNGGRCIAKAITAAYWELGSDAAFVYATLLTADELPSTAQPFSAIPVVLQQAILPKRDVRVTVVGDQLFAAIAEARPAVDWRTEPDRAWAPYVLPHEWQEACHAIVARLGLRFSGIDLLLDEDREHWFIELNPNGEWGWLEKQAQLPIAAALARELAAL